ncbi:hypothetical protein PAMA_014921 [Pampus argenteus]
MKFLSVNYKVDLILLSNPLQQTYVISMLFLPVLFLLSAVTCGDCAAESTPSPKFKHLDPLTGETLLCDKCPPGTHMGAYCTATTPTECLPCRGNHYTELWNYLPKCLYCNRLCMENEEVEIECTAVSNRVCRCKQGFYWADYFCLRHSECGPGHGVQTQGTPQLNTVCEKCSDGYFSNSSSALEPCVKQQTCENGQIVLLNGTIYHDTVCGSCQDLGNRDQALRTFLSGFFNMHRIRVTKLYKFVVRHIHKSGEKKCSKERGPLTKAIREWLHQASVEELKKVPQILKALQNNSMTEKLEKRIGEIDQLVTNCSLTL